MSTMTARLPIDPAKVLLTGGSGLLGRELLRLEPRLLAPGRDEFDLTDRGQMEAYLASHDVEVVLHAAATTSPPAVEKSPTTAMRVNIAGTAELVAFTVQQQLKLVYISTDYVFKGDKGRYAEGDELLPQNAYAWSKLGGECAAQMAPLALIIRTSFCEPEFPHSKAFVDQYTSRDSVAVIAPLILDLTLYGDVRGVVHVGTERKSVYDLARKLGRADVGELRREEVDFPVPRDTSFDLSRLSGLRDEN